MTTLASPRPDARAWARHRAALSRGVVPGGGSRCAVCGASPYAVSDRRRSELLSSSFSDHDLLMDGSAPGVCAGCAALLGGRPGCDPPPFRTLHALVTEAGVTVLARAEHVAATLLSPPEGDFALILATSRKRHAWLRAERCDARRIVVGTDDGPVEYRPLSDRPLLDAVGALLVAFGRDAVRRGDYSPAGIARVGAAWWRDLEAVVAPRRPSPLLDLLCGVLPRPSVPPPPPPPPLGETDMLIDADRDAVHLLAQLALGSTIRQRDGKLFWGGFFRHRVARFARLPLLRQVSRLVDELRVSPVSGGATEVVATLERLTPAGIAAVEESLRERGGLLVALAYDQVQRSRGARAAAPLPPLFPPPQEYP